VQENHTVNEMVILLCKKWNFGTIKICCLKGLWQEKKKAWDKIQVNIQPHSKAAPHTTLILQWSLKETASRLV